MTTAFCTLLTTLLLFAVTVRSQSTAYPGSCPAMYNCMHQTTGMENCRWGAMGVCITGLDGSCDFKQGPMTVKQVHTKFQDFCREISEAGETGCEALGECVLQSDIMVKMRTTMPDILPSEELLLDSGTWCQYLEAVSGCYVKTSNCSVNADLLSYMTEQYSYLRTTCNGSQALLGSWVVVVLLGALACGTKLFS